MKKKFRGERGRLVRDTVEREGCCNNGSYFKTRGVAAGKRRVRAGRFGEVAHVGRAGGREVRRRRVRRLRQSGEGGVRSLVVHGSERMVVGGEDGDVDVEERWFGDGMDLDDVHALEARDA